MRRALFLLVAVVAAGMSGFGWQPEKANEPDAQARVEVGPRFKALDLFVDSGELGLGAYQIEVVAGGRTGGTPIPPGASGSSTKVTLVGVEGGEHAAFKSPPHYDPAALHEDQLKDRIILAAFNTGADLPKGKTRVARIQVQVEGPDPVYTVKVMAAASADGTKIQATGTAAAAGESR